MSMIRFSDELHYIARGAVAGVGAGQSLNGISFPSNADAPTDAYVAIEYSRPDLDGLPIWGPGNAGFTVLMEKNIRQQTPAPAGSTPNTYYYNHLCYTTADRFFTSTHYWIFTLYPQSGNPGTDPNSYWEIASEGQDWVTTLGGSPLAPQFDRWYVQGMKGIDSGAEVMDFYLDLPSVANAHRIQRTTGGGHGNPATASLLVIGDSPWFNDYQHERFSGILGRIKIFAVALSEADILSEAADMSDVVTAAGQAAIWWGKNNFTSLDDLTCDYGTGRSFAWNNSARGTLVAISP